ncbi:MAG: hypothetical protein HQK56_00510 [Deltaproteobacteria bacterium]|nr:hypothetical protein [Deltaproteobacteria bacterium]
MADKNAAEKSESLENVLFDEELGDDELSRLETEVENELKKKQGKERKKAELDKIDIKFEEEAPPPEPEPEPEPEPVVEEEVRGESLLTKVMRAWKLLAIAVVALTLAMSAGIFIYAKITSAPPPPAAPPPMKPKPKPVPINYREYPLKFFLVQLQGENNQTVFLKVVLGLNMDSRMANLVNEKNEEIRQTIYNILSEIKYSEDKPIAMVTTLEPKMIDQLMEVLDGVDVHDIVFEDISIVPDANNPNDNTT